MRVVSFSLVLLIIPSSIMGLSATVDVLKPCPNNDNLAFKIHNFSIYNVHGKTIVSYFGELTEILNAPLELRTEGHICDLQKSHCFSAPGINYPEMCSIAKESLFVKLYFSKMHPPITKCPVNPVNVTQLSRINLKNELSLSGKLFDERSNNRS